MNRKITKKNGFFVIVEKEGTVVVCQAMDPSHGGNGGFVRREDRAL